MKARKSRLHIVQAIEALEAERTTERSRMVEMKEAAEKRITDLEARLAERNREIDDRARADKIEAGALFESFIAEERRKVTAFDRIITEIDADPEKAESPAKKEPDGAKVVGLDRKAG